MYARGIIITRIMKSYYQAKTGLNAINLPEFAWDRLP